MAVGTPTTPWRLSASQARNLMTLGTLSASELMESVLARIDSTEDEIQAWAALDADAALS